MLPIEDSSRAHSGRAGVACGYGRAGSVAAQIIAQQEFAGYWEYLLEEAIFTAPRGIQTGAARPRTARRWASARSSFKAPRLH
jgi:hypothetical protein